MNGRIDLKMLASRENEQVEWKENVADIDDVIRTITAFANDYSNLGGGYVVCGARELKDEHGFQKMETPGLDADRFKEIEGRVTSACYKYVNPPITPIIEEYPASTPDRRVLIFIIPATNQAHSYRSEADGGRYYIRVGRRTIEARNGLLRELLVRKGAREPWDRCFHPDATIEDIDLVAFRDLLQRMNVWDPAKGVEDYLSPHNQIAAFVPSFCTREPLTGTIRPRNFALLLFGRNAQQFYPEAHVIFSVYPGSDRSEPYSERLEIGDSLIRQIETLIDRLNTQAYMLVDKTTEGSANLLKYPRRALHEAVVNALAHRDYDSKHPVRVTAFSDRIEILSPGALPSAVIPELFREGKAMPVWRNQSLAWFLNRLQLAQAEGQGIATILRTMREEGCPTPTFELNPENVLCCLPAHPRHAKMRELQEVERIIALGRIGEAKKRLKFLLEHDPFNFRTLQLFCEIQKAAQDVEDVVTFVKKHENELHRFSAAAQIALVDTLTSSKNPSPAIKDIVLRLIRMASQGKFEEVEARRIVVSLLKLRHDDEALQLLNRLTADNPTWSQNPVFLQLRGRTLLQFAKKCFNTARRGQLSGRLKARTWDECRSYIADAERDLSSALEHNSDPLLEEYIKSDLQYLEMLKQKAQKPRSQYK